MSNKIGNNSWSLKKLYVTSAIAMAVVLGAVPGPSLADVVSGTFVSGSGSFTQEANKTTITVNTTNSITEFQNFNIPTGDEVHYQHATDIGHSRNLSRVTGGNATSIMGRLTSNDVDVYLINPNGVIFGNNSQVNVPNLVVSTTGISDANFSTDNMKFDIKGKSEAQIINNGNITIADGGLAALVAPSVENNGVIVAHNGKVALAGGDEFTLDMYGDNLVNFAVSSDEKARLVKQSGTIAAENGVVLLTVQDADKIISNVVNMDGVIEAKTVKVRGDTITLGGDSQIVAKNSNHGGNINIRGKKTTVTKGARLVADADIDGSGGTVSVYGDDELNLGGKISAHGKGSGVGGFVDLRSANGNVSILDAINVGVAGTVNIEAGKHVDLDAAINSPSDLFTLTGSVKQVNILSDNGIINQAIKIVNAGGTVDLAGLTTFDQTVNIDKTLILQGHAGTIIAPTSVPLSQSAVLVDGANNVEINSVVVDGSNIGLVGIKALNSNNLSIINSDIKNNDTGIYLNSSNGLFVDPTFIHGNAVGINIVNSDNATVSDTYIFDNLIGVNVVNSNNVTIDASSLYLNNTGMVTNNSDNLVVVNSSIYSNGVGINFTNGSDNSQINSSTVSDNLIGINIANSTDLTVDTSTISLNDTGIGLIDSDNLIVVNSTVFDNGVGIDLANGSDNAHVNSSTVSGNLIGINITNSTDLTVDTSNVGLNNTGIGLIDSDNLVVVNSSVYNNGVGINLANGSDNAQVNSSTMSGNLIGINIANSTNLAVDTSNIGLNSTGLVLNDSDNLVVVNSSIYDNGIGINLTNGSDNAKVNSSTVSGSAIGINIANSANLTVDSSNIGQNTTGIGLIDSDNLTIINSSVYNSDVGVNLSNGSDNAQILSSLVYNNNIGVNSTNSSNLTISNSHIYNNTNAGLFASTGNGLHITGSNFHDNDIGISLIAMSGGLIENAQISSSGGQFGMVVDGNSGPIDLDMTDVDFLGTQSVAALQIQNATLVGDVDVSGVRFLSNAPNGWVFNNVTGEAPIHEFNPGDLDFNDTVFGDTYTIADIHLVNSTMDGFAENATFINDGGDPAKREARVIHSYDDFALGTIFYLGFAPVIVGAGPGPGPVGFNLGNIVADIANRTDLGEEYYHPVSSAGRIYDKPSLVAPKATTYNTILDPKVDISGSGVNIVGKSVAQLAGLSPAAGNGPDDLNNLETLSCPHIIDPGIIS